MEHLKNNGEQLSKDVDNIIQNYLGRRTFEETVEKLQKLVLKALFLNLVVINLKQKII
ncbi:MAG: hypothetical protein WBM91_09340 [Eudoraea sp.]|uniref:hypothetical protein n=1 Tax=Eudoraea sp. TaxID=1979955 RepID=UPI003C751C47